MAWLPGLIFPILTIGPVILGWLGIRANVADHVVLGATVGGALLCQVLLERVLPFRRDWSRRAMHKMRADVSYLVLATGTAIILDVVAIAAVYEIARQVTALIGYSVWPTSWPFAVQLVLAVLVADFGHYWAHRALHHVPALWEHHKLHHQPDHLHAMNFFRMHPIEIGLKTLANVTPLIFLGAPHDILILWSIISGVSAGSLNHANVIINTGWLDRWFSTPNLHRIHHSKNPAERGNLGNITMIYDRIFGTHRMPRGEIDQVGT